MVADGEVRVCFEPMTLPTAAARIASPMPTGAT